MNVIVKSLIENNIRLNLFLNKLLKNIYTLWKYVILVYKILMYIVFSNKKVMYIFFCNKKVKSK